MELMALSGSRADWQYLRHWEPVELFLGGVHEGHTMENATYMAESMLQHLKPDLLLVCGDRWEIALACVVATKLGIPIAHLGAGETTLGSYDEQFRGAIEAMASIKFAMTQEAYAKIRGDGYLVGCTSVEPGPIAAGDGTAIIIMHPETRGGNLDGSLRGVAEELCKSRGLRPVVLGANPDRGSEAFPGAAYLDDFHERLRSASVIIGNSSAGIIEAPILGTPTVNVGIRQLGRPRAASIYDCAADESEIQVSLERALKFGKQQVESPYWRPGSVERIREVCNAHMLRGRSRG